MERITINEYAKAKGGIERITTFDEMRKRYVVKPDAPQGENIQRLGMDEDRDEAKKPVLDVDVLKCRTRGGAVSFRRLLGDNVLYEGKFDFCPDCGQRLEWEYI